MAKRGRRLARTLAKSMLSGTFSTTYAAAEAILFFKTYKSFFDFYQTVILNDESTERSSNYFLLFYLPLVIVTLCSRFYSGYQILIPSAQTLVDFLMPDEEEPVDEKKERAVLLIKNQQAANASYTRVAKRNLEKILFPYVFPGVSGVLGSAFTIGANLVSFLQKLCSWGVPIPAATAIASLFAIASGPSQVILLTNKLSSEEGQWRIKKIFTGKLEALKDQIKKIEGSVIQRNLGFSEEENYPISENLFQICEVLKEIHMYFSVYVSSFAYSAENTFMYLNRIDDWLSGGFSLEELGFPAMLANLTQPAIIVCALITFLGTLIGYFQVGEKYFDLRKEADHWWEILKKWSARLTAIPAVPFRTLAIVLAIYYFCHDELSCDTPLSLTASIAVGFIGMLPYQIAFNTKPVEEKRSAHVSDDAENLNHFEMALKR
ncbi:MAG: hypothetical protein JSS53_00705 [Proteobacteria bacterium]|nr:hypothetical protein [Pseudomonadota bacterium]